MEHRHPDPARLALSRHEEARQRRGVQSPWPHACRRHRRREGAAGNTATRTRLAPLSRSARAGPPSWPSRSVPTAARLPPAPRAKWRGCGTPPTTPGSVRSLACLSVNAVAFSPDGRTLAAGPDDGAVRLWDTANHTRLASLSTGSSNSVIGVAFNPDGRTLAAGTTEGGGAAVGHRQPHQARFALGLLGHQRRRRRVQSRRPHACRRHRRRDAAPFARRPVVEQLRCIARRDLRARTRRSQQSRLGHVCTGPAVRGRLPLAVTPSVRRREAGSSQPPS